MALQDQGLVARGRLARWAYAGLLAALLVAMFTVRRLGVRASALSGEVIAFGAAAIAVAALLPLRPERRRYAAGLALLALSTILFWLESPAGPLWPANPNRPAFLFAVPGWLYGLGFTAVFAAGWVALAWSVASIRSGALSYIAAGGGFALFVSALSGFHPSFLLVMPWYALTWPWILFHLLGVFGTMFG